MTCPCTLAYSPDLAQYDHGGNHPLRPERFVLTHALIEACGLLASPGVAQIPARVASIEEVELVHSPRYVQATIEASNGVHDDFRAFGYGPGDNPIFHEMHDAAARVVGATIDAAGVVLGSPQGHAFSPAGGLHHAMRNHAAGFCVYNDPAAAIAWMLGQGVERIAYVDIDVHHGDGVQALFYDDPRVLTISIHESGRFLFPGTGAIDERGGPDATGSAVNIPLPPYTGDEAWRHAFTSIVPPLVEHWRPEVLVTQLGCDTHATDPLAHLSLTTAAYAEAYRVLHELAHTAADGRWLATGGGGYQWASVAPRAWTLAFAEMAGIPVNDDLPATWVALASQQAGDSVPATFSDVPVPSTVSREQVEPIIDQVREAIFPLHGMES